MLMLALAASLAASIAQAPAPTAAPAVAPSATVPAFTASDRRTIAGLVGSIQEMAVRHPARIRAWQLGESAKSRPIPGITLASELAAADARPAILVVAGMDGHRWAGTETALAAVESLAAEGPPWLGSVTVYVIPRANPDAAERFAGGPRWTQTSNDVPHDNDRDGYEDENPPEDLDGNGVITQIRARRTQLPWPGPTHVADPAEPRLLRTPDPASGVPAEFTVWTEGVDRDGDGRIAEDWTGGLDPDRNFPHDWPEFEDESGPYPLVVPEAKAIANFVQRHRNVFAVLVLGRHDTVVKLPDPREVTAMGLPAMLQEQDLEPYAAVAKEWCEAMGQKRSSSSPTAGSLVSWLAVNRGIPAFASTLWGRPDLPDPPAAPDGAPAKPKPTDQEAAAWLRYSDEVRGGAGFVPWKPVRHPQLKDVEVGGWVPGFRENPPIDEIVPLAGKLSGFLGKLADRRPVVNLAEPSVSQLSPGTWRITTTVTNAGKLPTVLRPARASNHVPPHTVRVSVPVSRVQAGQRVTLLRGLDPGQEMRLEWIVVADPTEEVSVELALGGDVTASWRIRGGRVERGEGPR